MYALTYNLASTAVHANPVKIAVMVIMKLPRDSNETGGRLDITGNGAAVSCLAKNILTANLGYLLLPIPDMLPVDVLSAMLFRTCDMRFPSWRDCLVICTFFNLERYSFEGMGRRRYGDIEAAHH